MRTLWRILTRTIFWSYERGTWPYDLMVVAILAFVLLTPRSWFHDQPQVGSSEPAAQIRLLEQNPEQNVQRYRIDAGLLAPPKRTPDLEREAHELLSRNAPELKGRTFQIVEIEPVRGEGGAVLGYDISVKPLR